MRFGPLLPIEMAIDTAKAMPTYVRSHYRNARLLGLTRRNAARFAVGQGMLAVQEVASLARANMRVMSDDPYDTPPDDTSI